jgi:hypothetical protein
MATFWSCLSSACPPTEMAPVDVSESGEAAGAESEGRFTTDGVAALLNVPLDNLQVAPGRNKASGLSGAQGESLPK